MLKGVELADAPLLMGYVSTTRQGDRAKVLLVSDYGDPILAKWNYGLGRSVAFTSDAKNRWGDRLDQLVAVRKVLGLRLCAASWRPARPVVDCSRPPTSGSIAARSG